MQNLNNAVDVLFNVGSLDVYRRNNDKLYRVLLPGEDLRYVHVIMKGPFGGPILGYVT